MSRVSFEPVDFETMVPLVVIGAGAAGMVAALAAREQDIDVLVIERDSLPRGSTALSAGLIPAPATRWQVQAGIQDDPSRFAADILRKANDEPDQAMVGLLARTIGPVLEWLADRHDLPLSLITNFNYPGHSALRMHGLPSRSGEELIDRLREAANAAGVDILCDARVTTLFADANARIRGIELNRPDGASERIGCGALIVACNGYGGNRNLVARHIPELAQALYFGHPGNQGDAICWGEALGAQLRHLSGHQGHGSVAHPHGILVTWATIMEGGFQVNCEGLRFSDESHGYSEQAAPVIAQPDGIAFTIFDSRIAGICRQFEDFRRAEAAGAIVTADDIGALALRLGLPKEALANTANHVSRLKAGQDKDAFGRHFTGLPDLVASFHAVKVTGALFHTQGGLVVDNEGRVLDQDGKPLPNLYAAGGAACGVSGSKASGYLSGNGLLTAVALGYLAGRSAGNNPGNDHRPAIAPS
jgi:fumarate reductase flavoprotein subunit